MRAIAEIIGKLATFVLFAALARTLGEEGVGTFVLALAFLQVALVPVGLGSDSFLLRSVAKDRTAAALMFRSVLRLKLTLTVPVVGVAFAMASLLGYDATARTTIYLLSLGVVMDITAKTFHSIFNAHERGDLLSATLIAQRIITAALGLIALALGYGVVVVAGLYSVGAAVGLGASAILMHMHLGVPARAVDAWSWRRVGGASMPFAIQDVFAVLLFKLDIIILAALASDAAVGRYGAAYRLVESTLFIAWALNGAFAAMYAYLGPNSVPTVSEIYERSVKAALALLTPCAIALGALAEPICRAVFGSDFTDAAATLRLLSPVVVGLCVVILSSSLIISRRSPRVMVTLTATVVSVNIALNFALIPSLADRGAALAMLLTELLFVTLAMRVASREVGGIAWRRLVAAPAAGGAVMLVSMVSLASIHWLAGVVGPICYVICYGLVDRWLYPADFAFILSLLRGRLKLQA